MGMAVTEGPLAVTRTCGHQKCAGACPELREQSETEKNLCFISQREGSRV